MSTSSWINRSNKRNLPSSARWFACSHDPQASGLLPVERFKMRLLRVVMTAENRYGEARPERLTRTHNILRERSIAVMLSILMAVTMAATSCIPIGQGASNTVPEGPRLADLEVQPCPRLGVAFPGGNPDYYYLISEGGMGVARISVPWSKHEPQEGVFDWYSLDKKVVRMQQLGIEPFLTFESDAEWGVESTTKTALNKPPADLSIWKRFVKTLVERYDADGENDSQALLRPVRYYQVLNEWVSDKNKSGGWTGTDQQLIEFVNATYDAIKASDSDAVAVLGGIAAVNVDVMALSEELGSYTIHYNYDEDSGFTITPEDAQDPQFEPIFEAAYRVLRGCRYDYADAHLYGPVDFNDARIALMKMKAPKRPLLSSEFGGPSRDYDEDITPEDHFMAAMEYNLDILARGLEFGLWFRLGENPSGSTWGNAYVPLFEVSETTITPKGGYWAYKLLAGMFEDLHQVQRLDSGAYIVHRVKRPPLLVAWRTPERDGLALPPVVQAQRALRVVHAAEGVYAMETVPESGVLSLGELPVVAGAELPGDQQ